MAKRRKRASTKPQTKIVRVGSAPAPIIRVTTPRAAPVKRRARRSSHRGGASHHIGGIVSNEAVQAMVGGALFGFAVKSGIVAKLPEIPLIGRTGTAAILLDYYSRHGGGPLAARAARAAAAIAGYQLGAEGKITGDMMLGDATTPGSMAGDEDY